MSLQVTLISVDPQKPIYAIKSLRSATGGSLKWAKRDIHDMVRSGFPQSIEIKADAVEDLRENGWLVRVENTDKRTVS